MCIFNYMPVMVVDLHNTVYSTGIHKDGHIYTEYVAIFKFRITSVAKKKRDL